MTLIDANQYLKKSILLHAMQGFYLLEVPIDRPINELHSAFIGDQYIVFIGPSLALLVRTNKQVIQILQAQLELIEKGYQPILGVLTQGYLNHVEFSDISLTRYQSMEQLKKYLTDSQINKIQQCLSSSLDVKKEEHKHANSI